MGEWIYGITLECTLLTVVFIFNILWFFTGIIVVLCLLFYISLLALISLPKLIL